MKKLTFLLIAAMTIILLSCNKEKTIQIQENDISGDWRLNTLTINGIDGEDLSPDISTSTFLGLRMDDDFYFRNYVSGTWSVTDDQLLLTPADIAIAPWEYTINEFSQTEMTLTIYLTETDYHYNFPQFTETEVLTIVETYIKE